MITATDNPARRRRDLLWAFLASCTINLALWAVAIWLSHLHVMMMPPREREQEYVVSSSAARIEQRRPVPVPRSATVVAKQPPAAVPQHRAHVVPQPQRHPREIARTRPNAEPQQPQNTFSRTLAQQEQQFAREAARLHAANAPLSTATISPQAASAMRKQYVNISGDTEREGVQAVLVPLKHWFDGNASCYYVRYDAEFTGGGSEQGIIPWPVCYPRTADRMLPLDREHALPIPYPPAGFALPHGSYITPLLRGIYDKRPNPDG